MPRKRQNTNWSASAVHSFSSDRTLPLDGRASKVRIVSNAICALSAKSFH
jgi:hypothetical protein